MTTLARLVARVRDDTTHRLWRELEALLTPGQRRVLDRLLEVPPGLRVSDLERWRKGPPPRGSGPAIIAALDQVAEIQALGLAGLGAEALVPPRRMGEPARYGMTADAWLIRRHPDDRRLATLLATSRYLEAKSVDDALELLDLLMSAELLNKAQREADRDKARKHPRLARASARLAVAVETVPPPGAGDPDDWRAELLGRYQTVAGFLKLLPSVISFGASAEGAPVLAAMRALPDALAYRSRLPAPLIPSRLIDDGVVTGPWRRLVFGHPAHEGGAASRHAYAFCLIEQFWRGLKRRDIYADASTRWRNPQARLLEGNAWQAVRADVLTTLELPGDPAALLAEHARALDAAYWEDILRVVASIYTGTVRAYDVVAMLQRDGHPTALGEAIAMYGRIFKSLHVLSYIDTDETYRRDIKGIRNLQEGWHSLARKICHGRKGELYHRYERGLENQLGALGLVLNCVVLWTTVYLDAAVRQLRAQGYPVREEDMARLSPFVSRHLGVHGTYSFVLPDLAPAPSANCATPTPPPMMTSEDSPAQLPGTKPGGPAWDSY